MGQWFGRSTRTVETDYFSFVVHFSLQCTIQSLCCRWLGEALLQFLHFRVMSRGPERVSTREIQIESLKEPISGLKQAENHAILVNFR